MITCLLTLYPWCIPLAWFLCAGWLFSHVQCKFPATAQAARHSDLLFSLVCGFAFGVMWPVGLLLTLSSTQGAHYGLWRWPGVE